MAKVIKEVDWNGHHYTFTNTYKNTGTKSHDILTMEDENGNSWTGETTWINRPWHRFDLEEAFNEIVSKAFGPKALELVYEIDKTAHSVESAIDTFFEKFDAKDIEHVAKEQQDDSSDARKQALANYLEVNVEELEEVGDNEFQVNGETYLVLTDEEADDAFDEHIRDYWEDYGLDGISGYLRDWILENALDESQCEDLVRDEVYNSVYDWMDDEEVVDECESEGIVGYDEVYDEDGELRDDIDFDDLRERLVDEKFNQIENYAEYLIDAGFDEDVLKDFIDDDMAIDALKDNVEVNGSGRGQEIAYYDGEEHDLGNGLFAYRTE